MRLESVPDRLVVVSVSACLASPVSEDVESEPKPSVSKIAEPELEAEDEGRASEERLALGDAEAGVASN